MVINQDYIIATEGINTKPEDTLYIATLGLIGFFVEIDVIDIGQSSGSVDHINYNLWPQKTIKIKINMYGKEIIKEYKISLTFAKIVISFLNSKQIMTEIVVKFINTIKTTIKARKL